jgi:hypothetical protein
MSRRMSRRLSITVLTVAWMTGYTTKTTRTKMIITQGIVRRE